MFQKYITLDSLFTDIANAIRQKKEINKSIIADDFPDEINSIENGNDIINFEEKFIKRTIQLSSCENSHVTVIGDGAFINCSSLTSVSFPQAVSIGNYAFYYCSSLTSVHFPLVTTIGHDAFFACTSLTSVNFSQVTNIGSTAFATCTSLTSVSFPKVISIGNNAFQNCRSLTSVNFPQVITIENSAFGDCSQLTSVNLGGQQSQSGIIYAMAFIGCDNLIDLHLQGSYLYLLTDSYAFDMTPIEEGSGSIYVPASLYSQYISATNWTYFSSRFVSVSQSPGGEDIPEPEIPGRT